MPIAYLNFVGMLRARRIARRGGDDARRQRLPPVAHRGTAAASLPGIASSFLLLFVSSIAEAGNPVLLSGNYDVLSVRIYLAVIGEFNLDKAAVYSMMLLVPSLAIFAAVPVVAAQEYVTVTGKVAARSGRSSLGAKTALGLFALLVSAFVVPSTDTW